MEEVMKRVSALFAKLRPGVLLAAFLIASSLLLAQGVPPAQPAVIKPGNNLVVENIPPVPAAIAEKANQYGEFRAAALQDWHPTKKEMLIGTRFADVQQIHMVQMPGGARTQLTFFPDRAGGRHFGPKGDYFTFSKDVGGGEWFQIYRYDIASGNVTLLTDGKSRNGGRTSAHNDNRIAYTSTRRTGKDTDIWIMDPTDPKTDKMFLQLEGGGWGIADWSPDNKKLLVVEEVSANQSYLWLADVATGEKKPLTPKAEGIEVRLVGRDLLHHLKFFVVGRPV